MLNFRDQIKRELDDCFVKEALRSFIRVRLDYDKSKLIINGMIPNVDLQGCSNSTWELTYNTELTYQGSIAVVLFDFDENHVYLTLSNCTRVVIGSSGILGVEYLDKSDISVYLDEALDKLGTQLNNKLSEILKGINELRTQFSAVYHTVSKIKEESSDSDENTVWVSKNETRVKIDKKYLDNYILEGYEVSPKKTPKAKKSTKKTK